MTNALPDPRNFHARPRRSYAADMGRTAIVAALAMAVAIGVAIALRAPTGTGVVELPAGDSAPSAREPPVTRGERAMDATRSSPSADANVSQRPATDGIQAGASMAVDSSLQQPTNDDASVRAGAAVEAEQASGSDDSSVETPVAESSLSAQEAHDFFVEGDACLVLASNAKSKERCTRAAALAELIVKVPKTSTDSWAYGMEYELNRRLTELLDARDLRVLTRRAVQCNALGCLVYVEGPSTWPGKFKHLTAQIRSDPDIGELNRQGRWPGARPWSHGVNHGSMLVLPRY
jgi:hypothetical protein